MESWCWPPGRVKWCHPACHRDAQHCWLKCVLHIGAVGKWNLSKSERVTGDGT
jgi:hypothetical protein